MFNITGSASTTGSRESVRGKDVGLTTEMYNRGTFDTTEDLRILSQLLQNFNLDTLQAESSGRARVDAQGAINNIFQQYAENYVPEILGAQAASGGYGSTGAQLLANDAFARTSAQAAELELGLAQTYTDQQLRGQQSLSDRFLGLIQANLNQTGRSRTRNQRDYEQVTKRNEESYSLSGGGGI